MTCCVALRDPISNRICVGADCVGTAGLRSERRADPKIFRVPPYVVAFTSSYRMGQLIAVSSLPAPPTEDDDAAAWRFAVSVLVPEFRRLFADGGFRRKDSEQESGGTFLLCWGSHMFSVGDDFQVAQSLSPFTAIGCAMDVALGSLYSTCSNPSASARVITALSAAAEFSAAVRPPFRLMWT